MVEEERVASVCLSYDQQLRLFTTDTLWHCTTAESGTTQILLLEPTTDGDVVSSMNQRTLCSHWPAGVWVESTAGQQRGTRRPISHSRTGRDLRGQRHPETWLNALLSSGVCPHVSQCQSDVHHAPESTLGKKRCQTETKEKPALEWVRNQK